jgi:hypothetical protein
VPLGREPDLHRIPPMQISRGGTQASVEPTRADVLTVTRRRVGWTTSASAQARFDDELEAQLLDRVARARPALSDLQSALLYATTPVFPFCACHGCLTAKMRPSDARDVAI